ncbi:hypothetical protein AAMO2058_000973500 [Amorphochlora amoebiformis]
MVHVHFSFFRMGTHRVFALLCLPLAILGEMEGGGERWSPWIHISSWNQNPIRSFADLAGVVYVKETGYWHVFGLTKDNGDIHHFTTADLIKWNLIQTFNETTKPLDDSGSISMDQNGNYLALSAGNLRAVVKRARNILLTEWGSEFEELFSARDPSYQRGLPGDPVSLTRTPDGIWRTAIAIDACNVTSDHYGCPLGAREQIWESTSLMNTSEWKPNGVLLESNKTCLDFLHQHTEFVTPDYVSLSRKKASESLNDRLFLTATYGPGPCCQFSTYWNFAQAIIGMEEKVGDPFQPDWARSRPLDWSAFRPIYSPGRREFNQTGKDGLYITSNGFFICCPKTAGSKNKERRLVFGNLGYVSRNISAISLPRDLWLEGDYGRFKQAFAPELVELREQRVVSRKITLEGRNIVDLVESSENVLEIQAVFEIQHDKNIECGLLLMSSPEYNETVYIGVDLSRNHLKIDRTLSSPEFDVSIYDIHDIRAAPLPPSLVSGEKVVYAVHVYVDRSIITVICNNETAITVEAYPSHHSTGKVGIYSQEPQDVTQQPVTRTDTTMPPVEVSVDVWKLNRIYTYSTSSSKPPTEFQASIDFFQLVSHHQSQRL